ncbi:MAG TPA: glycosyltransferase [Patescibacteria group bacterium]|nr:glycosyltransferase [Patescibacteria group bacterium]
MAKKILILYTAIGQGHKSLAENIGWRLSAAGYEVRLANAHQVQSGRLVSFATGLYRTIVRFAPFIWRWLYDTGWFISLTLPWRTALAASHSQNILNLLNEYRPDLVISTHTTPSAAVSYLKRTGKYAGRFAIAFSDFHLHRYWLYQGCDLYLANTGEQKREMTALGVPAEIIAVCGITLKPLPRLEPPALRQKFGLGANDKVVLLASGSQGTGLKATEIAALAALPGTSVIAVCGKNQTAFRGLSNRFRTAANVKILGFYPNMEELYAIADLFVTKPGGISVAEALRQCLPLLITHQLPGQEQHNLDYLLPRRLVMPAGPNWLKQAQNELSGGGFKNALRQNPAVGEICGREEELLAALAKLLK